MLGLIVRPTTPRYAAPSLQRCAVEDKRHIGTVMCRHMCANSACVLQRVTASDIMARLCQKLCIYYCTVLYCKLWTQAVASKSTSKFSQFFYTTNRLPVPL